MQGSKKCADGFSDSSSIGSMPDDADREVSSLTDRAFRSLCVSEDMSFHESDLALSPDVTHQVLGPLRQGTVSHTHRKSGIWSQLPAQGTQHTGWAATLQQLPKYVQGEEKDPQTSPPLRSAQRRLEVPVSGLRNSGKPASKVSSLIKSFDRTEAQCCDSRPPTSKPPALKNPAKFAPLPESGVHFCFDSAFLTVRRVPAEVSSAHPSSHQPSRNHGEPESPKSPEMARPSSGGFLPGSEDSASSLKARFPSPPQKPAKAEAGTGQERAPRGTFLHSENSAFESWNAHQPKLLERKAAADSVPERRAPKYKDVPPVQEAPAPEHRFSPRLAQASCPQEENRLATGALSTSAHSWGTRGAEPQGFPVEGTRSSSQPEPPVKPAPAPWRKPKAGKGGREGLPDAPEEKKQTQYRVPPPYPKPSTQGTFLGDDGVDVPEDPSKHYSPPFNISKLLTPVLPTKHALESLDSQLPEASPSPPGQLNGYQEQEPGGEGLSRDSYKAKAPSLLFNLKDVRKRVKSKYSPSPLLKGPEEKPPGQVDSPQEAVSNGDALPNGLGEGPLPDAPVALPGDTQDPTARATEHSAHSPSSPLETAKTLFSLNGDAGRRSGGGQDTADRESDLGLSGPPWHPDPRRRGARKHLSLKLTAQEPEAVERAETHQLENGWSQPLSQETDREREAGLVNPELTPAVSPGPLSPEEEDVFYSDSQSDLVPGLPSRAKVSTSSSDQSFASFDDQQRPWCSESQREERQKRASAGASQKEKEAPLPRAMSGGQARPAGQGQGRAQESQGEGLPAGRPRQASAEDGNFRGSRGGGTKHAAVSHARDPTPSPSAAANKHLLFTIKDNTLRATPVIKPIMLPLLRTVSLEDTQGGGHGEDDLPRPGWGDDAGSLRASKNKERPSTLTATNTRGTLLKQVGCEVLEDAGQVSPAAEMDVYWSVPQGTLPSPPLVGESDRMKPAQEGAQEATPGDSIRGPTDSGKLAAPRQVPRISFPEDDLVDGPPPPPLATCWEGPPQDPQSHFLSAPRVGLPLGKRPAQGEAATSPNPSSLGESGACSPAASSLWGDAPQAPGELGLEETPHTNPWVSPGPARLTRRENVTHGLAWDAEGSESLLQPAAEDFRTLSPRDALLDSQSYPGKPEPPAQPNRAAGKPPTVPPKTEKALRRARKLANKRRKADQVPERLSEGREDTPWTERTPRSPGEGPRPRLPTIRALLPPFHRHSVSGISEPLGRRPWDPQPLTPLPPYPAAQKLLQDPQSGEYYVFDLPLRVKIKTLYDPETGKYVKVSVPADPEDTSPEPALPDAPSTPYLLYPGLRPMPVPALMPLRCSSQLSAPTFLRQGPPHPRPQSAQGAGPWAGPGHQGDSTPPAAAEHSRAPPQGPEEEGTEAPGLGIISTDDLEDFAAEGIS
ncbi:cardiac-enriched FHL2-interacting protein [Ctenodactylus gundi]